MFAGASFLPALGFRDRRALRKSYSAPGLYLKGTGVAGVTRSLNNQKIHPRFVLASGTEVYTLAPEACN